VQARSARYFESGSEFLHRSFVAEKGDFREAKRRPSALLILEMRPAFLTSILAVIQFTAGSPSLGEINQMKTIQGNWICVSAVIDGKSLPEETTRQLRLTISEKRYKTEKSGEVLFDSTYSLNSSSNPMQIDLLGTEGNLAGKHGEGIYSVDGDILRICYTMPGQRRPKEFESPVNSKVYLVIWKRDQSFPES